MRWEERKIASRYANALFQLAREHGVLEEVHQNMLLIANVCSASRDLRNMLSSPIIRHDKKRKVLEALFRLKLHKFTFVALALITTKGRERFLPAIASEFHVLYNEFNRIQTASIATSVSLDDDLRSKIENTVKKYSGREVVELEEHLDEALIGGFVLNIDDKQIDASLLGKLKSLKMIFTGSV